MKLQMEPGYILEPILNAIVVGMTGTPTTQLLSLFIMMVVADAKFLVK
jgi:hypothetical protein